MAFAYRVIDGVSILSFVHSFVTWVFVYEWELFSRFLSLSAFLILFAFSLLFQNIFLIPSPSHSCTLARSLSECMYFDHCPFYDTFASFAPNSYTNDKFKHIAKKSTKNMKMDFGFCTLSLFISFLLCTCSLPPPPPLISLKYFDKERDDPSTKWNELSRCASEKKCLAHCRR